MNAVTRAIIPVAGLGTRLLPASKAIPKEMLPVVDKPCIQYVVEEAIAAGIKQIILVTRTGKEAIENHFDANYELESLLSKKNQPSLLEAITTVVPEDVEIIALRQSAPKGLGHAVLCARQLCKDEPFAVMLPDVLVFKNDQQSDLSHMVERYAKTHMGQIMVAAVPDDQVHRYGIADCRGKSVSAYQSTEIAALVEKPKKTESPSNLAVVGRYILPARVMELLATTAPGAGGEIQLTDALEELLGVAKLEAYKMGGHTFDCGDKLGYLLANLHVGLRHQETQNGLSAAIKQLQQQ